jgi:hypothetical protein
MSDDLISIEREAACQAVQKYLDDYTLGIQEIQQKFYLSNKDIMSPKLIENPRLTTDEVAMLANLKRNLDTIINKVSVRVEDRRFDSYDNYTQKYKLNAYDRLRVDTLINSVRNINISIQKIKLAFHIFSYCNTVIINEFENCLKNNNLLDGRKLVIGNMLIVYELSNFLINFLERFRLEGIDDIMELSEKELKKISTAMQDLDELIKKANSIEIDPKVKEQVISNLNAREKSLELFKEEWDKYIAKIEKLQGDVGNLKEQLPTLKLMRANAQNQLDFYEIMKIFGIMMIAEAVEKSLKSLTIELLPLHELELISLPPDRVSTLLDP